jgi:VWFA-related protein
MRLRIASLFLFFAVSVSAQVKESIRVDLIEVPVTLTDRAGNPMRGLTKENFRLYDDGKEREITAFDMIDLAGKDKKALEKINPAARRNFMLLFDLSFTGPRSLANAREAATSFVKNSVLPRDRVAVATIDLEHGFKLLTAFTSDRELIAMAIRNPGGFRSGDPLQLSNEIQVASRDTSGAALADALQHDGGRFKTPDPGGDSDITSQKFDNMRREAEHSETINRDIAHSNTAYLRARVEKQVSYLGELARTLRGVSGHKQIVFLSEGFDSSVIIGRDARASEATKKENDDLTRGNYGMVDTDDRYGSATSQNVLAEMVKFFRGSDVVLQAVDIKGLRVQNTLEGAAVNSNAGLSVLSGPTGGSLFQNANDLGVNFDKMLHAQEVVYVLTFRAAMQKSGQFHDLKVKLVKVPGNPAVSARTGYWESSSVSNDERTLTTAEIILNDIPQDGLKVDAFTVAFPTETDNAQVPVVLELAGGEVVGGAHSNKPPIEFYLYAFDENGDVRDRIFQRVTLDLAKLKDRLFDAGVKFVATLSLPPGTYAIRSLVRMPESDRKGFARTDLVVPARGTTAMLTPVFIDANASWVTIKGASHTQARYPFHLDSTEFVPAATARIRSGETPQFAVFVQNASPDDVTIDTIPRAKFIGAAHGEGTSAFLMQLVDELPASVATIDVTLHKKGATDVQKTSVKVEP